MIFIDRKYDPALHEELINSQVYTLKEFQALRPPAEGNLFDVILGDPEVIDQAKWIFWLIKSHGFTRINNPTPDLRWLAQAKPPASALRAAIEAHMYPMQLNGSALLVAAGRPDRKDVLQQLEQYIRSKRTFFVAISPVEIRALQKTFSAILRN